jgi:polyisoprenoid-binding protein YceI
LTYGDYMMQSIARARWTLFTVFALVIAPILTARGEVSFYANGDPRDEVVFTSKAPLERITGKTSDIQAVVHVEDLASIVDGSVHACFVVNLASMTTGITMRDEHMRDRFLETGTYPVAILTLSHVEALQASGEEDAGALTEVNGLAPMVPTKVSAIGTLTLHGREREIEMTDLTQIYAPESPDTQRVRPGDVLHVSGVLDITLSDYGIRRPRRMFLKLAEDVHIEIDIALATGNDPPPMLEDEEMCVAEARETEE